MKKKFILLAWVAFLLLSCSTQKRTGCPQNVVKSGKYFSNPQQIQVKVTDIRLLGRNRAEIKGFSAVGDSITLLYGWAGVGAKIGIRIGMWVTVRFDGDCCEPGKLTPAIIKINR